MFGGPSVIAHCISHRAYYMLPFACAYCMLHIAYCLPCIAYHLLHIAHCLLHFAYCILPIAYIPIAYCLYTCWLWITIFLLSHIRCSARLQSRHDVGCSHWPGRVLAVFPVRSGYTTPDFHKGVPVDCILYSPHPPTRAPRRRQRWPLGGRPLPTGPSGSLAGVSRNFK